MNEIEDLVKQWRDGIHARRFRSSPSFESDSLVLGATVLLAKQNGSENVEPGGAEARLLTLLSVAYGRPVDSSVLTAIRRASKHADAGDRSMAAMHLALAGLGELADPADAARRIFLADGLLAKGVSSRDIFAAVDFDPAPLDRLEKYNPDELRNPKGSGRVSGEWAREIEAAEAAAEELSEVASRILPLAARTAAIATVAVDLAAPVLPEVVFVGALLIPTPTGGRGTKGKVKGHPELFYSWNGEETALQIVRRADDQEILSATLAPDGTLWDGSKRIGRKKGDVVVIDPFVWPQKGLSSQTRDNPRLCPKDTPDRSGRVGAKGEKDRDYEDHMKRFVNPENPTPRSFAYMFQAADHSAMIDDCKQITGDPWEAKSTGYADMLAKKNLILTKSLNEQFIEQAERQLEATPGRKLHWCFAEKETADHVEALFKNYEKYPRLAQIDICRLYWKEGMR